MVFVVGVVGVDVRHHLVWKVELCCQESLAVPRYFCVDMRDARVIPSGENGLEGHEAICISDLPAAHGCLAIDGWDTAICACRDDGGKRVKRGADFCLAIARIEPARIAMPDLDGDAFDCGAIGQIHNFDREFERQSGAAFGDIGAHLGLDLVRP